MKPKGIRIERLKPLALIEREKLAVATVCNGQLLELELFDPDEEEEARRRHAETIREVIEDWAEEWPEEVACTPGREVAEELSGLMKVRGVRDAVRLGFGDGYCTVALAKVRATEIL